MVASYDDLDSANFGSRPILLFTFARGTQVWRYCNQDENIDAGGHTWVGADTPISMDGNKQTGDPTQDAITFTVPSNLPISVLFNNLATSGGILCNVQRTFAENLNDLRPYWSGTITDRKMKDPASYQLIGQILSYTGNTQGTRLREGRGCTYQLYQGFGTCGVDKTLYAHPTTVINMDGASITIESRPMDARAEFYSGGFVEFEYDLGIVERRGIISQNGNTMTLLGGTVGMVANQAVTVYPGCPRDWEHCGSLYNNQDNYGGDPVFPGVSPFTTSIFQGG